MVERLLTWLKTLATSGPLEVFVFIGSILEELIAPIPAPLIMSLAGFIASERGAQLWYFIALALIGTVGKTIASVLLYILGDKAIDIIVTRWGKHLGIEQSRLDQISATLSQGWWDDALLVFLRAVPLIPTFIVSLACGSLKTPLKTFVWTTLAGTLLRNLFLLWLGVAGTEYVRKFWEAGGAEMAQRPLFLSSAVVGLVIGIGIALLIRHRLSKLESRQTAQ